MGWDYYEPSRPRAAKGGIKLQAQRGGGANWWSKRWLSVLESYGLGGRLTRGRSYARNGQVLSIDVEQGEVQARVQGSSARPYSVTISMKAFTDAEWERIAAALAEQPLFVAKLLAGEMPAEIETVFQSVRLPLFPKSMGDLDTDCSCPDPSNPCKHLAAVYYLLGEEFDRDPFLIFTLRGITREELTARLVGAEASQPDDEATAASLPPEPLSIDSSAFWNSAAEEEISWGEVKAPPVSAALVKRLGNFPFWRGAEPLQNVVEPIYRNASARGLNVFLGDVQADAKSAR